MPAIDPRPLALAKRLIALPSVSPDPGGEVRCAAAVRAALPAELEAGEWKTVDGRPVVWALLRGRSPRTVLLLTHYDTVGVDEFQALADPAGETIAFRPEPLRERLLALDPARLTDAVREDLERERRSPGTWLFGRGALDMKAGIAAGIAALEALGAERAKLEGNVLFIACPDEENQSAGMLRAIPAIASLSRELRFVGALNLDYVERPVAFEGVVGKRLVGLYVLGRPTHVGSPFAGVDAAQMAAAIVDRVTTAPGLVEPDGVPPVALRIRDVKPRYDVQTALEAEVELNLLAFERSLEDSIQRLRAEIGAALEDVAARMARLQTRASRATSAGAAPRVLTCAELTGESIVMPPDPPDGLEPRLACWHRVRAAARAAGLVGPAVVVALLPPYYPQSPPRPDGLGARLRPWLEQQGLGLERWYPYISDASYLAWRGEAPLALQALMPSWGREYRLPVEECRALDLDVVTLGPWGRDAHGLFERVECRFAFETLPGLIAGAVREALHA